MAHAPSEKYRPDIVDSAAKLSKEARLGIIAVVAIVMCGLFYALLYLPYREEVKAKENALALIQAHGAEQESSFEKRRALIAYSGPVHDAYLYMQRFLPSENEMARLVQMVSEIGARVGLTDGVTLFAPKLPAIIRENYAEIPFTLNLEGEFLSVLAFLYDFSRMDRIVNITEVYVGSPKMVDEKREILHITVKCSGSTYRSLTEAEMAAQAAAEK